MYLGIEIGGTKLQLGLGAGDGTLAALWRGAVDPSVGAEGIRRQIVQAMPQLLATARCDRSAITGAGIGFGGPVDDATRTVIKSHQIAGWDDFPLGDWVTEIVGVPAVLGNDADVAGLAEALFGAGKGSSPVFYITIGSGIGGGLVINGEIYRGSGRGAAEIGHLRLSGAGRGHDILEHFASGWAIERAARQAATLDPGSAAGLRARTSLERLTTRDIGAAAQAGDLFAASLLEAALSALAEGICHVIALLCPQRIVIGGGVALIGEEHLFNPLRRLVAKRVFQPFAGCYEIVPAALGEEVVVYGALALARERLG